MGHVVNPVSLRLGITTYWKVNQVSYFNDSNILRGLTFFLNTLIIKIFTYFFNKFFLTVADSSLRWINMLRPVDRKFKKTKHYKRMVAKKIFFLKKRQEKAVKFKKRLTLIGLRKRNIKILLKKIKKTSNPNVSSKFIKLKTIKSLTIRLRRKRFLLNQVGCLQRNKLKKNLSVLFYFPKSFSAANVLSSEKINNITYKYLLKKKFSNRKRKKVTQIKQLSSKQRKIKIKKNKNFYIRFKRPRILFKSVCLHIRNGRKRNLILRTLRSVGSTKYRRHILFKKLKGKPRKYMMLRTLKSGGRTKIFNKLKKGRFKIKLVKLNIVNFLKKRLRLQRFKASNNFEFSLASIRYYILSLVINRVSRISMEDQYLLNLFYCYSLFFEQIALADDYRYILSHIRQRKLSERLKYIINSFRRRFLLSKKNKRKFPKIIKVSYKAKKRNIDRFKHFKILVPRNQLVKKKIFRLKKKRFNFYKRLRKIRIKINKDNRVLSYCYNSLLKRRYGVTQILLRKGVSLAVNRNEFNKASDLLIDRGEDKIDSDVQEESKQKLSFRRREFLLFLRRKKDRRNQVIRYINNIKHARRGLFDRVYYSQRRQRHQKRQRIRSNKWLSVSPRRLHQNYYLFKSKARPNPTQKFDIRRYDEVLRILGVNPRHIKRSLSFNRNTNYNDKLKYKNNYMNKSDYSIKDKFYFNKFNKTLSDFTYKNKNQKNWGYLKSGFTKNWNKQGYFKSQDNYNKFDKNYNKHKSLRRSYKFFKFNKSYNSNRKYKTRVQKPYRRHFTKPYRKYFKFLWIKGRKPYHSKRVHYRSHYRKNRRFFKDKRDRMCYRRKRLLKIKRRKDYLVVRRNRKKVIFNSKLSLVKRGRWRVKNLSIKRSKGRLINSYFFSKLLNFSKLFGRIKMFKLKVCSKKAKYYVFRKKASKGMLRNIQFKGVISISKRLFYLKGLLNGSKNKLLRSFFLRLLPRYKRKFRRFKMGRKRIYIKSYLFPTLSHFFIRSSGVFKYNVLLYLQLGENSRINFLRRKKNNVPGWSTSLRKYKIYKNNVILNFQQLRFEKTNKDIVLRGFLNLRKKLFLLYGLLFIFFTNLVNNKIIKVEVLIKKARLLLYTFLYYTKRLNKYFSKFMGLLFNILELKSSIRGSLKGINYVLFKRMGYRYPRRVWQRAWRLFYEKGLRNHYSKLYIPMLKYLFKEWLPRIIVNFKIRLIPKELVTSSLLFAFVVKHLRRRVPVMKVVSRLMKELDNQYNILGFKIKMSGRFTRKERAFFGVQKFGRVPMGLYNGTMDYYSGLYKSRFGISNVSIMIYKK